MILGLFFFSSWSFAQAAPSVEELAVLGRRSLESPMFTERDSACQQFLRGLKSYLSVEGNYLNALPSVNSMMRLESPDKLFAIYTWQRPDSDYKYQRYGLLAGEFKGETKVVELKDALAEIEDLQYKKCQPDLWPGAIYYDIRPMEGEAHKYLLLGFAIGEPINYKILEILEVSKKGKIRFGGRHFMVDEWMDRTLKKPPVRLVLQYNAKYSASVRWNENAEMVIMDHLAPPQPKLKGLYTMYGPDFSYDALYWEEGWWKLSSGVKFNSEQEITIRPPSQPINLPRER
jgi:hypothetical protein